MNGSSLKWKAFDEPLLRKKLWCSLYHGWATCMTATLAMLSYVVPSVSCLGYLYVSDSSHIKLCGTLCNLSELPICHVTVAKLCFWTWTSFCPNKWFGILPVPKLFILPCIYIVLIGLILPSVNRGHPSNSDSALWPQACAWWFWFNMFCFFTPSQVLCHA